MEIKPIPLLFPMSSCSCSFLKPVSFSAVYFQNPIVLGTVKTQKQNRSLNPHSQNMSLMHQISLLNQELPPAWKLRAASSFSVALTEFFLFSDAQTRILFSLLTVPQGFVHCERCSLQIPFPSIGEETQGRGLQPGQAALLSCLFLGISA